MIDETNDLDGQLDPEDVNSLPPAVSAADGASDLGATAPSDPNDEIPVPVAMWPSEIDERAQVVEALRGNGPPPRTDTQVDPAE